MKSVCIFFLSAFTVFLQAQTRTFDLAITHATVLMAESGIRVKDRIILVKDGKIQEIGNAPQKINGKWVCVACVEKYSATKTINAHNKLVTPGFVDTHIHPTDVFGDRAEAPRFLAKDSLAFYRKALSNEYLPYGITTVLMLGHPENWLAPILDWQKNPSPNYTDVYTSGGALVSQNEHPYVGHTVLQTPKEAQEKVEEYNKLGVRHIKLYWRLNAPEFEAAYQRAHQLGMNTYGHIDQNVTTIDQTLQIGLTNYEHLVTLASSLIVSDEDWDRADAQFRAQFGPANTEPRAYEAYLEMFRFVEENKKEELEKLLNKLAENKASFSTTIHLLYMQFAPTHYTQPVDERLTESQKKRCEENFALLMACAKRMQQKGIELRIGTDMAHGGQAFLSELILLARYGFSVEDVFRIATYNGAKAMGIQNEVGSVEAGYRANLIIWDKNPLDDPRNFIGPKTVIKNGVVYANK